MFLAKQYRPTGSVAGVDGKAGHGLGHGHGRRHGHKHGHLNQTCMRVHQAIQPGSSTCLVVVVNVYLTREVSSASAGPPESPKTYMYRTHKLWISYGEISLNRGHLP